MVYTDGVHHPSLVELARAGNFQAIAHWLNSVLMPHGMRASVGGIRPGCLKVLVEFALSPEQHELSDPWRSQLIRLICHRIWKLNSAQIEGVRIAGKLAHEKAVLWEQGVRVVSPARRARKQRSQQLRTELRQAAQQRSQMKTMRSMLISGPPIFAFVFGCVLGLSKAPSQETNAIASSSLPKATPSPNPAVRPDTVQTALETVPVTKHDRVPDPNDPTVTLMFAGDVTLSDHFADAIGQDYERTFANMDEYRKADVGMVNLENPLTRATIPLPDKKFNFKADPDSVKALTSGGISLVNLANNHAMDYQEPGLLETLETLKNAGVEHVGAGRDVKEARRPEIIDVKGQRVAYFGYYGADFESANENRAGTNYADEQSIAEDIKAVRSQVDWVIVNYHWGEELATHPADWQVNLAHFTIDQGADVVVGHHPHVLQGAEIYKGRPIAYSMGNFIFGGNPRSDYDTAVLKVALKDKQMKVEFVPVEVRGYQPKVASERSAEILNHLADLSSGFQQPLRSPIALEARPSVPATTAVTPTEQPVQPTGAIASPEAPATSTPTETVAPSPSPNESVQPTPLQKEKQPGFANPSDSFITSPNRTPLDSMQPGANGFQGATPSSDSMVPATEPAQPNAPASEAEPDHASLPQKKLLSFVPSTQRRTVAASPASHSHSVPQPHPTPAPQKQTSAAEKHRNDWVASEHVGAELIPDVSLLAAMAW
ncbi:CapA family protein [Stenomitos frigidus]|uniref:Poly-gamma-glutamate biosynthesis protein n=1 Tax=Stenomitos frigidus ULC18 TaxID=2107698 RepID=A0A2T1E569_9CYAN|nr:CapA family protein [Stenomitos frigidus]PSB27878.1 poly-gamma-glutamate biosynthesis protein [Stenomitos frigidus ULC18]